FCQNMEDEKKDGSRIVMETKHFIAFIPYAALSPFHTWLYPKRHMARFTEITNKETDDLAVVMKALLGKFYYGLKDPDFNYVIRSAPATLKRPEHFHWYITFIPRVTKTAGFELGSGMFINPSLPEKSAEF
ncbi:MAG: galactose-1-phosphate uridylyltransferase, partial [Candidatus Magasanikbacteria bacterium CG_4_10_14_0_8_um_filter_32_14]